MSFYTREEQQDLEAFFTMTAASIPGRIPLANKIAVMVLSNIQSRLPQCGVISDSGLVTLTREVVPLLRRDVLLLPQFLFMINWADSGPGISWPESYNATYLPIFHRYIVTASLDSSDMWGVTDLAIGSFTADLDLITGSGEVICTWWAMQADRDQERFAYVWSEGSVSSELAYIWADKVWGQDIEDGLEEEFLEPDEPSLPDSLIFLLAGTDEGTSFTAIRQRILADDDLLLLAEGIRSPAKSISMSQAAVLVAEFEKTLPKPQGVIAAMARGMSRLPKLQLRIELFRRIVGRLPTVNETTSLYNIT